MVKISFIGAGRVGATSAFACLKIASEIALVDINKELADGEALDLKHASYALEKPVEVKGGNDYSLIEGSDVIVVTAGVARKPGMTRLDLAKTNAEIIKSVAEKIKLHAKNAVVIVVTNPVDLMTYVMHKKSGFERKKVIGMGNYLDTARLWCLVGENTEDFVIGEHGENMFVFGSEKAKSFEHAVRNSAIEVISKKGATFFAPAASVFKTVKAIVNDTKELLPVSAVLNGEYGINDIALGVPAIIGKNGIEKIVEIEGVEKEMKEIAKILREKLKEIRNYH